MSKMYVDMSIGFPVRISVGRVTAGENLYWKPTFKNDGGLFRLVSGKAVFNTNATVANRIVNFSINDGSGINGIQLEFDIVQTASDAQTYNVFAGANKEVPTNSKYNAMAIPDPLFLEPTDQIKFTVRNPAGGGMQTGDYFDYVFLFLMFHPFA